MNALLSTFVPIWVLTAIGYLVSRSGLLGDQAEAVLGRFVFHVAMPAALFTMVARTSLSSFANASMLAFVAGTVVASGLGFLASGWLGRATADRAIGGMAAGYVNSGNLGIPVSVQVFGDASFVAPVMLFQVLLVTPVILALVDAGRRGPQGDGGDGNDGEVAARGSGGSAWDRVRRTLLLPVRNPIIMASALGCVFSVAGWQLPQAVGKSVELLGGAGVPTALVTLGMSLHTRPAVQAGEARRARAELTVTVLVKNLLQPLVAYAVGAWVLDLPPSRLLVAVLFSALPTAQNVFIYARQYDRSTALPRDAVLCTTLVSMLTLTLVTWLLGPVPG
ncbi:AEC family transporter [Kitasatospora camelliae]|uniref:AEC family transporter n=1 Tax=Kitasatospora camelliae TaxID=3156397 RepID=A0AAU8JWG2_9ACTN